MEKGKSNLFNWLMPNGVKIVYNPKDNVFLSSKLQDDNGNINLFKMIVDEKAPELTQRIYAQ